MPRLTLSMIVKNEEKYLRDCLNSVNDIVDEIVIVDTGSNDRTIEIAEEFNSRIFHFSWVEDFSAARNFALSKSNGDWILYMDADERLSANSIIEIKNIIHSSSKIGVNCLVNSLGSKGEESQRMKYIRLFKNDDKIRFSGSAHEQIEPSLLSQQFNIIDSNIEILHLGYDVDEAALMKKAERNLKLLLKDYSQKKSSYLAYQIANSYSVLKNENEKNKFYREAISDSKLSKELRSICFLHLADAEMRQGNFEEAKQYFDNGLSENKNHSLLNLVGSQIYGKLNDFGKAIKLCENALASNKHAELTLTCHMNQSVLVDEKKIIYQGLLLSILSNNEVDYGKFLSLLDDKKRALLTKLKDNKLLSKDDIIELTRLYNHYSNELILKLLNNYKLNNKYEILAKIHKSLSLNPKTISYFSSYLISENKINEAIKILEKAIREEIYESSIIMYLSSIYIKTNQYEKLFSLLENVELKARDDTALLKNLILLKDKLQPFFENQFAN